MRAEILKGHLDLLLLGAVARGPAHGYALIERVRERSSGAFALEEGTLYPALHRLEEADLLKSRWEEARGRKRRVYSLTAAGRRALETQARDFKAFTRAVLSVV